MKYAWSSHQVACRPNSHIYTLKNTSETSIINCCIEHCCYPASWKMGMVTPLYKKDDEFCKINYRPVTVLPALNNIFERLLSGQMYEFYNGLLSDFISAYRKFYSCETSLLRLTKDWRMMRDRGAACCGSFYGSLQSVWYYSVSTPPWNWGPMVWTTKVVP